MTNPSDAKAISLLICLIILMVLAAAALIKIREEAKTYGPYSREADLADLMTFIAGIFMVIGLVAISVVIHYGLGWA